MCLILLTRIGCRSRSEYARFENNYFGNSSFIRENCERFCFKGKPLVSRFNTRFREFCNFSDKLYACEFGNQKTV